MMKIIKANCLGHEGGGKTRMWERGWEQRIGLGGEDTDL